MILLLRTSALFLIGALIGAITLYMHINHPESYLEASLIITAIGYTAGFINGVAIKKE